VLKIKIYTFFFYILISNFSVAQKQTEEHFNGWLMYFGTHKFTEKWGLHIETQLRRNDYVIHPQQLLLRGGLNYHLNNNITFTAGYCFVETYPYGKFPSKATFPEDRIWEQLQIKTPLNKVEWISRFRLEQRFVKNPVYKDDTYKPGAAIYTNRFRLLNRFSIPLNNTTIEDKTFYISAYDELFINFGKNVALNIFDQNRAYLAIGYKIPKLGRLEIGYLNQLIVKSNGIQVENNHTLQLGISSTVEFIKAKK